MSPSSSATTRQRTRPPHERGCARTHSAARSRGEGRMSATVMRTIDLARRWRCSERHVRGLISTGQLPAFRLGANCCEFLSQRSRRSSNARQSKAHPLQGPIRRPVVRRARPSSLYAWHGRQSRSRPSARSVHSYARCGNTTCSSHRRRSLGGLPQVSRCQACRHDHGLRVAFDEFAFRAALRCRPHRIRLRRLCCRAARSGSI